jgi:hypothetical protein
MGAQAQFSARWLFFLNLCAPRPDVCLRTPQVLKPIPTRKPRFPQAGLSLSDASNPLAERRKARTQFSAQRKPAGAPAGFSAKIKLDQWPECSESAIRMG